MKVRDKQVSFLPVCSDQCESRVASFLHYYRKTRTFLILGIAALAIAVVIVSVLGLTRLLPVCLGVFGGLIIAFPFTTRETIRLFGLRNSILFIRIIGFATILYSLAIVLSV